MSKASKWYLFYLLTSWHRQRQEIMVREFETELDMLVWASKNPINKSVNLHHVISPDGLTKIPNDLYERIDVLKRELVEKETKQEETTKTEDLRAERLEKAAKEWKRKERRKAKEEAACTQ